MTVASASRAGERTATGLTVALLADEHGPPIGFEPVMNDDLLEARSEVWRDEFLRRGDAGVGLEDLAFRVLPVPFAEGPGALKGYVLEALAERGAGGPGATPPRRAFTRHGLHPVALRGARRLVAAGELAPNATFYYEIREAAGRGSERPGPASGDAADPALPADVADPFGMTVRETRAPLLLLSLPLAPLRERAAARGPAGGDPFPVFYTAEALAKAEGFARRGGSAPEPVETGAALVGPLCVCPESGEIFAVVADALEATDAEETRFSLAFTGKTWARIQAAVSAIRSDPLRRAWRILGQGHGHPFLPNDGAPPCAECASRPVCGRTTVFVSQDDLTWSRVVFPRQPWKLCHVFGLSARSEPVDGLFGLHDGRLLEREYHVIPDFPEGGTA